MPASRSRVFERLVLVVLAIAFPLIATGQTFRGGINGTITDSSGAVVSGAKVTAKVLENPGKLKAIARAGVGVDSCFQHVNILPAALSALSNRPDTEV